MMSSTSTSAAGPGGSTSAGMLGGSGHAVDLRDAFSLRDKQRGTSRPPLGSTRTMGWGGRGRGGGHSLGDMAEAIVRFLNLNARDEGTEGAWQGVWKILLYDDYCQNVLAPLLKVGELRKQGITLHLYA